MKDKLDVIEEIYKKIIFAIEVEFYLNKDNFENFNWENETKEVCRREIANYVFSGTGFSNLADISDHEIWNQPPPGREILSPKEALISNLYFYQIMRVASDAKKLAERRLA